MRPFAVTAYAFGAAIALLCACGESRRPIGEECLRDDDCLSSVCAARSCVSAPVLVTGAPSPPDDEEPRIPVSDAGTPTVEAPSDASDEGS